MSDIVGTLIIHYDRVMNENDIENITNQIYDQLRPLSEDAEVPRIRNITPQSGYLKVECLNDSAIVAVTSIITNLPEKQLNIVLQDFFPNFQLSLIIPEIGINDARILSQFCASNPGLTSSHWRILERIEVSNGMLLTINIDFATYIYAANNNSRLNYKNYQLNVNLFLANIMN